LVGLRAARPVDGTDRKTAVIFDQRGSPVRRGFKQEGPTVRYADGRVVGFVAQIHQIFYATHSKNTDTCLLEPVTRRRPGTDAPVDGSTCPVPVRHETISHRLSDGSRPRQRGRSPTHWMQQHERWARNNESIYKPWPMIQLGHSQESDDCETMACCGSVGWVWTGGGGGGTLVAYLLTWWPEGLV
jgi:hypothetical protein